jgi:two-component system sensor histidine kinase MprB
VAGRARAGGPRLRVSFRTRLALAAAAAVGIAVALASAASFFVVRGRLLSQVDKNLRNQAVLVGQTSPVDAFGNVDVGQLRRLSTIRLSGLITIQVVRQDGNVLIGDSQIQIPFSTIDAEVARGARPSTIRSVQAPPPSGHLRVLTFSAGPGYAFQLAYPLADIDHTLGELGLVLFVVATIGVGVALVLGYAVAQAALRPVQRLTEAAEHVAATQQLDATIEPGGDDELGRLARSFNAMLEALAASRSQQSQLVSDAGHELRTPLTSLRTNIEVLARVPDLPEADRQALISDVTAQLGELTTLVGDLVELAREEEAQPDPEDVRFDAVVERALERARRRAPSVTFNAHVEPSLVRGQPVLLERAVLNLLDNAVKWSPRDAEVDVGLHRNGHGWQLEVRDHGPGIGADDLPFVFDRFYRAPTARSLPGSGLGLAIVRQVVETHGGRVTASSPADGGTLMTVELPAE